MGLDITAYSNLRHIGVHYEGDWCEDEDHISAYAYDCFPQSFRGLPVLRTKNVGGTTFFEGGCYERTEGTDEHGFRAGSYGGYGQWRNNLREQFNPDQDPHGPFYELIYFADNEGSIGPEAAADLLEDFRLGESTYRPFPHFDTYKDWMRACELAAQSGLGLISFH